MGNVINTPDKQVIVKTALIKLRSGTALYKEELENILRAFGVEYEVPSEDFAKGLLISLVTNVYGYDERRLTLLMSLGLLADYSYLKISERRIEFVKHCGEGTSTEAIRKRENRLLQLFIETLQKRIAKDGIGFVDEAVAEVVDSGIIYAPDHGSWRVALPRLNAS